MNSRVPLSLASASSFRRSATFEYSNAAGMSPKIETSIIL